ncbi:MAG TPA: tetratricopeptide repeat protein [Edaphocola sp.]|nr:tetratricopeptide repeat protein [Edaphocola sp.]
MKTRNILSALLICGLSFSTLNAQQVASPELIKSIKDASDALNKGDYNNAIALYKYAIRMSPDNVPFRRDLAYCYFLQKNYDQALESLMPVLESELADPPTFQLAAGVEQAKGSTSKAKKTLNEGLKKFPNSGLLYYAKGNLLLKESKKPDAALAEWTKGIQLEPSYANNYFNLAQTLFQNEDYLWSIIYAEKYINLDNQGAKAVEMRTLLLNAYKNLFATAKNIELPSFKQKGNSKNELSFEKAAMNTLANNISTISDGFTTDNVIMLRSRFLIAWNNHYAQKFPESQFSYQTQMMQSGYFPAYNQWIFGAVNDSQEFGIWVNQFKDEYQKFEIWKAKNQYIPSAEDNKRSN